MNDQLTVLIADDHPLFRKGVADILRADTAIAIVAEAAEGETALRLIQELRPRVAILDIDMPRMSGLEVARAVAESANQTLVVLLTMYSGADMLQRALSLGVRGYVSKESAVDDILACLHLVASGRTYVSSSLGSAPGAGGPKLPNTGLLELTAAERRVLKLISQNRTTREIAGELSITPKTAEHHRSNICQKLGVTGNNALVRFCLENFSGVTRPVEK